MLQWQKTRGSLANTESAPLLSPTWGWTSLTSFSLPCWRAGRVTDTEGSQWRVWQPRTKPQQGSASDWRASSCTQRTTQAFIGPSPSHLSHKIGFVEALPSAEKAKVDYGGRRSWNGITSGMVPNITPYCLNANHDWIMNDLCSLLSRLAWLGRHFSNIFMLLSPKKASFITILWGENAENEDYNYNNQSHTKCNAGNEGNSIKISCSHINLFLNLLWTLRRTLGGAPGGSSDPYWETPV